MEETHEDGPVSLDGQPNPLRNYLKTPSRTGQAWGRQPALPPHPNGTVFGTLSAIAGRGGEMALGHRRRLSTTRGLRRASTAFAISHLLPLARYKPGVQKPVPIGCGGESALLAARMASTWEF